MLCVQAAIMMWVAPRINFASQSGKSATAEGVSKVFQSDLSGRPVQVLPSPAKRGVVVFFVLAGCPNAQAYAPEMNRIAKEYGHKGWRFYLDFADSHYDLADLKSAVRQFGYGFPVVVGQGDLLKRSKATMSPECAVFSASGRLRYHGRIDDRFYALGKQRLHLHVHDLRAALDAIGSRQAVRDVTTPVIGCFLPGA